MQTYIAERDQKQARFRPTIIFSTNEDGKPVTYIVAQTEGEEQELLSILHSMARQKPQQSEEA